jgi:hypothetical protein
MKTILLLFGIFSAGIADAAPEKVEFNRDIRPIMSDTCFKCHGFDGKARKAGLRLDVRDEALKPAESGAVPIVPGKPDQSEVVARLFAEDEGDLMPPKKSHLVVTPEQRALIRRWIAEGAEYQPHWALVPPKSPKVPGFELQVSSSTAETRNPKPETQNSIDAFVRARLAHEGLVPSPEADAATLRRRVALALTGLPPEESAPSDYAALVEHLLASPHFGERMALEWLDAARYADTNGFYNDSERQAWPWRDWVIRAFNENMPFDRFTIEQLAGDLLPSATPPQLIATGFNRNHMVTNETGIIEEEYRMGYVADRVDTTATVWLGLTVGCARCHDHKYDPITQRDYYRLFAAFNSIDETGIVKDVEPLSPAPAIMLPTPEQDAQLAKLGTDRKATDAKLRTFKPALEKEIAAWEPTALAALPAMPAQGERVHFAFDGKLPAGATTSGTMKETPGVKGQAADFDATQYVEFPEPQPLERDRPFTLSLWIMPGNAPQGCVVSKMDSDADGRGFEILWYKSQPRITLAHRYSTDGIEVVADQKLGRKQWRHVVVTYDGSSKAAGLKVYVDGVLSSARVRRDNLSGSIASAEPWRIAWKGTGIGFEGSLDEFRLFDRVLSAEEVGTLHWREFLEGAFALPAKERTRAQADTIETYYIEQHGSAELRALASRAAELKTREEAVRREILSVSVMHEMDKPRETHVLARGQYDHPAERVEFGVPASLSPLPSGAPANRLGLAQWLVARDNPLTARVAVNRLWAQCFGEGLVRTVNDFGLQGETPIHPELLDWLAVRFMESGWDVKAMMRLLVTSATFRQRSDFTPALLARDPENRLLARGPRFRLPAETIRDQALAISGLLVGKIGGPSVKPYQPPGLWEAVSYNGESTYVAGHGEELYRRGLYTYWKRQSPPPGMMTFDAPTREVCAARRPRTNTPLQSLVLLNDVTYVEAARALAGRMMRAKGEPAAFGFHLTTGRAPSTDEAAALQHYHDEQLAAFHARPESAKALLKAGESAVDPALDSCDLAAWTLTATVLLNLDEVLTQH